MFKQKIKVPNRGYYYTVTEEQIQAHQKRTIADIFNWIESTNRFVHAVQTQNEKDRHVKAKYIANRI